MDLFLQLLANGLVIGTFYALSALGLTLVFGLMRVVNFAHGELYVVGGLLGWALTDLVGLNFFLTLAVVVFSLAVGGYLIDRLLMARVRGQGEEPTILLTIGLSIFLTNTALLIVGTAPRKVVSPFANKPLFLGPVVITQSRLVLVAISAVVILVAHLLIQRTTLGRSMRATFQDSVAAQLSGIRISHVYGFTFALGAALAGAAGMLLELDLCGAGNHRPRHQPQGVRGRDPRRHGKFRRRDCRRAGSRGNGSVLGRVFVERICRRDRLRIGYCDAAGTTLRSVRQTRRACLMIFERNCLLVALVVALLAPLLLQNQYAMHIGVLIMFSVMLATSFNLIVGYVGEFPLGHTAFLGVGAYTAALFSTRLAMPYHVAELAAPLAAALFGLVIGAITLRLRGPFFVIVTLCFAEVLRLIANNWIGLTNGPMGISGIEKPAWAIAGDALQQKVSYYYVGLLLAAISLFVSYRFVYSNIGRAAIAVRENRFVAQSIGISPFYLGLLTFVLAAGIAGLAGGFYANYVVLCWS